MKIYKVGGAVRDQLLGLPVIDCDYVVVGATPEQLLAQGFRAVGKHFPVFLHPHTHEEYALARTERKCAPGHTGFSVDSSTEVCLEQDLARRDLTINAIAEDENGRLIDPYGGIADLQAGRLRHVSQAFVEDPLRVLRTARFAARLGFTVAPETVALMRSIVACGELEHLASERIWQELSKGLMTTQPSRMFAVLSDCYALQQLLPALTLALQDSIGPLLDKAAAQSWPLAKRWALVVSRCLAGQPTALYQQSLIAIQQRLKSPKNCYQLAELTTHHQNGLQHPEHLTAEAILKALLAGDALRRPQRFIQCVEVACFEYAGHQNYWLALLQSVQNVVLGDNAPIANPDKAKVFAKKKPAQHPIAVQMYQQRLHAIYDYLAKHPFSS